MSMDTNYEPVLGDLNLLIISSNQKGEVKYISPFAETLLGFKVDEKLKKKWWEKTCLSENEIFERKLKIENVISGNAKISSRAYIHKIKCNDGNFKWIEWRDSISKDNYYTSVGVNVTNRKTQEIARFHSETIINSVDAMVLVSESNGNVIFSSPSVERMLGYTVDEILGDNWWNLTYENQFEAQKVREAIHNFVFFQIKGFTDISKRRIKTKDGDYKWIEWQLSKGLNDTYISIGTDITSRISAEIELKEAKETAETSVKVKDEFLSNMSHEIRTPLNAVIGFTELLLESELTIEQREHLETMKNSGEILLSLINNVLDLAKLDSNKVELENISFNLHKSLNKVVKLMKLKAHEKSLLLELKIDPETPVFVYGDPTRMGQIMLNLIGNAIKFTNEGSVVIEVKPITDEDNVVTIYFEIKDTGIGIVSNKISTVFGVFTQAKSDTSRIYGGTGLGLAIVKKLVHLLNGEIKVHSKFGVGSVFKMTIPFEKDLEKMSNGIDESEKLEDTSLNLKILLVEDNKTNQMLAKTRLERWNCSVDIANNGIEGVKKVQKSMYDIILMDIQMPVMDGYEATKIIKNDLSAAVAKIPIIAMTAYTSKKEINRAFEAGMDDYIFKPFKKDDLLLLLKKYGFETKSTNEDDTKNNEEIIADTSEKKFTDLNFLKQESLNETSILILLIELFIKDVDEYVQVIKNEVKNKNWEILHRATHKIKPNVSMFGISSMEPIVHSLMKKFEKNENLDAAEIQLNACVEILKNVKTELLTELKTLKDE
jgi:PAS domain S-box-containing protein